MSTLYLECNSGISGDMTVAALLDAGADFNRLKSVISSVHATGCVRVEYTRVKKAGLDCGDFNVVLDEEHENHDHDMDYLYGHEYEHHHHDHEHEHHHDHEHEHHHDHEHEHHHDHEHDHHHDHEHNHHHSHTSLSEINHIIEYTDMSENAKNIAKRIFRVLAEAEAKAHGVDIEEVHFHEVGAIDSIVDIISVAFCLDDLKVDKVIVQKICEGTGTVRCQHGILSVPVPAVTNIVSMYDLPIEITERKGELVTPTGAAIVAAVKTSEKLPQKFSIKKVGMGAGKREYEIPSIVRAMIIEEKVDKDSDKIIKLESNIDDCTGEALGYVMNKLLEAGARDVNFHPVVMKKNRPAWQINVICDKDKKEALENIIFSETTTIGIRSVEMDRVVLKRSFETINTKLGEAKFKVCELSDGKRYYPEYDSIVSLCEANNMAYTDVYTYLLGVISQLHN